MHRLRLHPDARGNARRFGLLALVTMLLSAGLPSRAEAKWRRIVTHGSRHNRKLPVRPHTRYIVLHTTEGAERGALHKLSRDGEAHYLVGRDGTVYRIVDRRKLAAHAGRSMWEGRQNVDRYAIGIEVVGYHDRPPTRAQLGALKQLVGELKSIYRIPDRRVLTHSMVAFGVPNRYHRRRHRGRKRCGMVLAAESVRRAIGLTDRPARDPDVAAGRLVVADRPLFARLFPKRESRRRDRVLASTVPTRRRRSRPAAVDPVSSPQYRIREGREGVLSEGRTPWDIAREAYASASVTYVYPDGTRRRGDQITAWASVPVGTRVIVKDAAEADDGRPDGLAVVGEDRDLAPIAGDEVRASTTIYLFPDGLVRTGAQLAAHARFRVLLDAPPEGTRVLVGYQFGGYVKANRPPSTICGAQWNYPSTFYRFPDGKIVSGDAVDPQHIPQNTLVFFRG